MTFLWTGLVIVTHIKSKMTFSTKNKTLILAEISVFWNNALKNEHNLNQCLLP